MCLQNRPDCINPDKRWFRVHIHQELPIWIMNLELPIRDHQLGIINLELLSRNYQSGIMIQELSTKRTFERDVPSDSITLKQKPSAIRVMTFHNFKYFLNSVFFVVKALFTILDQQFPDSRLLRFACWILNNLVLWCLEFVKFTINCLSSMIMMPKHCFF